MKNNTVVYSHSINNVIFYIGCGNESRPYDKNSRNKKWVSTVNNNNGLYDIKIISVHEERDLALAEESKLIMLILPCCNMSGRKNPYKKHADGDEKIVNISIAENVFNEVAKLAKENKRSVRAEIAVIVEDRIREINKTK